MKPVIILVDDSPFIQFSWSQKLGDVVDFRCFSSPDELLSDLGLASLLAEATYIILDVHFDDDSDFDGIGLAEKIRPMTRATIILSSDAIVEEGVPSIDCVLPKSPLSFEHLVRAVGLAGEGNGNQMR